MSRTPCPVCDFPLATGADSDIYARSAFGDDDDARVLGIVCCWSAFGSDHRGPAIDWRARALEAEADVASVSGSLSECARLHDEATARVEALEGALEDIACDIEVVLTSAHADAADACARHIMELTQDALFTTPPKPTPRSDATEALRVAMEALERAVAQLADQQAMPDPSNDAFYRAALELLRAHIEPTPLEAAVAEVTR